MSSCVLVAIGVLVYLLSVSVHGEVFLSGFESQFVESQSFFFLQERVTHFLLKVKEA